MYDININVSEQRRPIKLRSKAWAATAAAQLVKAKITPNQVSVASAVFASAGAALLIQSHFQSSPTLVVFELLAVPIFIQLRLLCNMLDGLMAVEYGKATKSGELFNEMPDRVSDFALLAAAGYAVSGGELAISLGWAAAGFAVCTAYVRAFGARYMKSQDFSGPMAKQHRMFALTVGCLATAIQYAFTGSATIMLGTLTIIALGSALTCVNRLKHLKAEMENN